MSTVKRSVLLFVFLAVSAFCLAAVDIRVVTGADVDLDFADDGVNAATVLDAGARSDGVWRFGRGVSIDSRSGLSMSYTVPNAVTAATGYLRTGLTRRTGAFSTRLVNNSIGRITTDGSGDFFLTELAGRVEYSTLDFAAFVEPGVEWEFGESTALERYARAGVSALVSERLIAEVTVELGDVEDIRRYQRRIVAETAVSWYTAAAMNTAFGLGWYSSDDVESIHGNELPAWTYTEATVRAHVTFGAGPHAQVTVAAPNTVRWYDHAFVREDGGLGDAPQRVADMRPSVAVSLWPAGENIEVRSNVGVRYVTSNTRELEQFGVVGGLSLAVKLR